MGCTLKQLPEHQREQASDVAVSINPANRVSPGKVLDLIRGLMEQVLGALVEGQPRDDNEILTPGRLALLTRKQWPSTGIKLTCGFPFDSTPPDTQRKILLYANKWSQYCNISFVLTNTDPQVRINRDPSDGYWSYLGTDVLSIPRNQPTMNLGGFTILTPDREYDRVVCHEFGHTLGFPHEHMREELIARLDRNKTIAYFQQTQGWSPAMTIQQVLTPLSQASIRSTPNADQDSIMCYQLPGSITVDGQPIRGGAVIDSLDGEYAGKFYPLAVEPDPPPPPPQPPGGGSSMFQKILATISALRAFATDRDFIKLVTTLMSIWGITVSMSEVQAARAPSAPALMPEEATAMADALEQATCGCPEGSQALPGNVLIKLLPLLADLIKKLLG